MKKKATTVIVIFVFLIGLSLLLYPTLSDRWNAYHQSRMIISHADSVEKLSPEVRESYLKDAAAYNEEIRTYSDRWKLTAEEKARYEKTLVSDETGIISYIEIPKIKQSLPIYHGTATTVL